MKRMEILRWTFLWMLSTAGIILILCDGEEVGSVVLAKLLGLVVCWRMSVVCKRWLDAGKLAWMARILDE